MKHFNFSKKREGSSLVEVLLALSLFIIIITLYTGIIITGQEESTISGEHIKATALAREGIEATRNIRDSSFGLLIDGEHGLNIAGNQWEFNDTSETIDDFTRVINISSIDVDIKGITSTVTWKKNARRDGEVILYTHLANWSEGTGAFCSNQNTHLDVDLSTVILGGGDRELDNIFLQNTDPTCDIVIDKIVVTWTDINKYLVRIRFDNNDKWSGSESLGTEIDINDTTIANVDGFIDSRYRFDGKMNGNTFNIDFIMGDGTTKSVGPITP